MMDTIFWTICIIFGLPTLAYIIGRYITIGYLSAKNSKWDDNKDKNNSNKP